MAEYSPASPACRFCAAPLRRTFVDLGMSPLCQRHVEPDELNRMEPFYPLHVWVCESCFLVQLEEYVEPREIFSDYAYFSSYSASWVKHAGDYVSSMRERYGVDSGSLVVEVASNDGYLLRHFQAADVPVLGVEPAANVARAAIETGIPTVVEFFGLRTAERIAADYGRPDLIVGNNVLAHVPDINDFVSGLKHLLKPDGVVTMEFPHLLKLIEQNQFDTIYHEHYSYLSFSVVERIFRHHGLVPFDVEELPTHGGSLRIHACHHDDGAKPPTAHVEALRDRERRSGLMSMDGYEGFQEKVRVTKRALLSFLVSAKENGSRIVGYGAPGKGNTLLNYCGIGTDFLDFTVDRSPHKQGRFTPGMRIPILHPDELARARPDYVLILPWNLKEEIMGELDYIREWGGRFVVPIPAVSVLT